MKKAVVLFTILIFLLVPAVYAERPVIVYHTEEKPTVYPDEVGRYTIILQNNQEFDDTFYVSVEDLRFAATLQPITHLTAGMKVPAGEELSSELYLVPSDTLRIGEYSLRVEATSKETGETYSDIITIYLAPEPVDQVTVPDVSATVTVPQKIDPRSDIFVDVALRNNNDLELTDLQLEVKSSLFTRKATVSLNPKGAESQRFKIKLGDHQAPRSDLLVVSLSKDNRHIAFVQKDIEVITFSPPFDKSYVPETRFMKKIKYITLENKGNVEKTETVYEHMPFYKRWFTSAEPEYSVEKNNGKKALAFTVTLKPQEKVQIAVATSYRTIIVILLLIAIGFGIYIMSRSPIVVYKQAQIIKKKEGGISMLKVYVHVKNRTNHTFDDVRIVDKIQKIAKIVREKQHIGTIKPNKIANKKNETLVEWKIPKLSAGEERIIIYKIESSLSILGDFKLRKVLVEFHKDGVKGKAYSNEFYVDM